MSKEALQKSFHNWLKHTGQYSLFGAPLVYHMVLSLPAQQGIGICKSTPNGNVMRS